MTTITPVAQGAQSAASKSLAGNFDTFLTLLTAQLQNQDPLSPMDSNQFTQQLVQYSQVEQQIDTNQNLKSLIALGQSRFAADAVGYLGKAITVSDGRGALNSSSATWNYGLSGEAVSGTYTITDASGKIVKTGDIEKEAGQHVLTWDGKTNAGDQCPDGGYTLSINALASDGSAITTSIASGGVITEVDLSGNQPLLMIGAMPVSLSEVTSIGVV